MSICYPVGSENYCFYTNGSLLSLNEAKEFYESKNSTLPIIINEVTDSVFQRFIVDDSFNVIRNRSVWIDAYAGDSDNTRWRWISGRQSGINSSTTYVDAAYCYRRSSVVCLSAVCRSVCHDREPCKNR